MFDIIGDVHGYASKLEFLLKKLGYEKHGGYFMHSERKAVFVGDYIDRGPENPEVVNIVRNMVDHDAAIAIMGNHEYNAICYNTIGENGEYLRPRNAKNTKQHQATLEQYNGKEGDYNSAIDWFKTLPLHIDFPEFRAVHACYDQKHISYLDDRLKEGKLSETLIHESADKTTDLYHAVDITCKGKEAPLPDGQFFLDKDKHKRQDIRIKWWLDPQKSTTKEMSIIEDLNLQHKPFKTDDHSFYAADEKPVFFGHYWLQGEPNLYRGNICCLDYSVAKDGYLTAYRFDGEGELSNSNFVFV